MARVSSSFLFLGKVEESSGGLRWVQASAEQNLDLSGPGKVVSGPQIRGILLSLTCFLSPVLPVCLFLQRLYFPQVLAGEAPPPCVCGTVGNGVRLQLCNFRCEVSGATGEAPEDIRLTVQRVCVG